MTTTVAALPTGNTDTILDRLRQSIVDPGSGTLHGSMTTRAVDSLGVDLTDVQHRQGELSHPDLVPGIDPRPPE